jgi:hypothetical protein
MCISEKEIQANIILQRPYLQPPRIKFFQYSRVLQSKLSSNELNLARNSWKKNILEKLINEIT